MDNGIGGTESSRLDESLGGSLRAARERLLSVYAELPSEFWDAARFPYFEIVNPPVWEIAHVAWFQEYWCRRYDPQQDRAILPSILPNADALFDSRRVAHRDRWTAVYPELPAIHAYLRLSLEAAIAAVAETSAEFSPRYFARLSLHHEQMHAEALLMTLRTLGLPLPARFSSLPQTTSDDAWVTVPAGQYRLGADPAAKHFIFDNEKCLHDVQVGTFRIANRPVLAREFQGFIESGGYDCDEFWTGDGLAWRNRHRTGLPSSAANRASATLHGDQPACHVSLHEARAYCNWAGRRLPKETEWEVASRIGDGLGDVGLVWEWTDTPFAPFPGFRPDPYREYSQPWFGDHVVLKGGSWLTHPDLKRSGFRNFYRPHRDDVFAGFRTCAV